MPSSDDGVRAAQLNSKDSPTPSRRRCSSPAAFFDNKVRLQVSNRPLMRDYVHAGPDVSRASAPRSLVGLWWPLS